MTSKITGREPRLSIHHSAQGQRRLSLRGLATMLHALPPEQISLDVAEAALRNEAFFVRYNAGQLLAKRGDRDARMVIQRVLRDGSPPARATAARHLFGFSWYSAEPLLRDAMADPDTRVREAAVYAMCDLHDLDGYALLAELLAREPDNVKMAAAWGLRECGDPAAVPVLKVVLQAEDPDVRVQGLEALGATGSPQAVPVTWQAIDDPVPNVVYEATLSLLELVGEQALVDVAARIRREQGAMRAALLRGLFHGSNYLGLMLTKNPWGGPILDALEESAADSAPEVRSAAIWPLAWMRTDRADQIIQAAYHNEADEDVKAHILRVAVNLMTRISETLLRDALALPGESNRTREIARQIMRDRENGIATFDESDTARHGLFIPHLEDSDSER